MKLIPLKSEPDPKLLAALGLDPLQPEEFPEEALFEWLRTPRIPIWVSKDPLLRQMITAVLRRARTSFHYIGGSAPGRIRTISTDLVFRIEDVGPLYDSGYCHDRGKARVFRYDRMLATTIMN
jgi:predicted DNA-binding transcriptional regulator YafY